VEDWRTPKRPPSFHYGAASKRRGSKMSFRPTSGHFTKGMAKVIVSDYRYFLFAIYDIRFTQLKQKEAFNHG
jgi:hypothetical protein